MNRRTMLGSIVTLVAASGCLGDDTAAVNDPDTDPESFLPDAGEGWEVDERLDWDAAALGDETTTAVTATYVGPDDGRYRIVIVRWENEPSDLENDAVGDAFDGQVVTAVRSGLFTGYALTEDGQRTDALVGDEPPLWRTEGGEEADS